MRPSALHLLLVLPLIAACATSEGATGTQGEPGLGGFGPDAGGGRPDGGSGGAGEGGRDATAIATAVAGPGPTTAAAGPTGGTSSVADAVAASSGTLSSGPASSTDASTGADPATTLDATSVDASTGVSEPTTGSSEATAGSGGSAGGGVDPIGPGWDVGDTCMIETFTGGLACDQGQNLGDIDPTFENPCPDNCVRNNHDCTWSCRPTCAPNPDACGTDPCSALGYGQCAWGICWPFSHCTCVEQGLCDDCASAPCP